MYTSNQISWGVHNLQFGLIWLVNNQSIENYYHYATGIVYFVNHKSIVDILNICKKHIHCTIFEFHQNILSVYIYHRLIE